MAVEDYIACVAAFESGHDRSQPEYLKALATVVRAYALSHRHRHPQYDLCDLSHCQVYQGLPPHFEFWKEMAEASRDYAWPAQTDQKLLFFHRCCGGILESSDQIWGGSPSPNRVGPDSIRGETLCRKDSFYHWTSSTEIQKVALTLREMEHLPSDARLANLQVSEKTTRGRNKTLSCSFELPDGQSKSFQVSVVNFISEFGKSYGWRVFPSAWFTIQREGELFRFSGKGFGHGIGLCQSGAYRLAQMGWDWRRILKFYFPVQ